MDDMDRVSSIPWKKQKSSHTNNHVTLIDTDVLQYQVFPYLLPCDFMSLLLTCHEYNDLLNTSPCFLYCRMLKTFQFDRLPPIAFFSSQTALNIRTSVGNRYKSWITKAKDRYEMFINDVSQMEEEYGMELLKLYHFLVTMEQKNPEAKPWFINLMKELAAIAEYQPDDQRRIDLIEKYKCLFETACYKQNTIDVIGKPELQMLCLESAEYGLQKSTIMMVVQLTRTKTILQYLSQELRNDKEIVLEATSRNAREFEFASSELKRDPDVILAAAKDPVVRILPHMDADLRDCKELMLKVISMKSYSSGEYKRLSARLQSDRDILLEMVATEERFFYADLADILKQDEEFVRQCIVKNPKVMQHVVYNEWIKDDEEFVLANPGTFIYASFRVRSNREIAMQLDHKCGWDKIVPGMYGEMLSDVELWRAILSHNGNLLQYADPNIKSNAELVRIAAANMDPNAFITGEPFQSISEELMRNKSFAFEMLDIIEKSSAKNNNARITAVWEHWIYDEEIQNRIVQIQPDLAVVMKKYQANRRR